MEVGSEILPPDSAGEPHRSSHEILNPNIEIPASADLLAEQVLWQARAVSCRQAKQIPNPNDPIFKMDFVFFLVLHFKFQFFGFV
jgi:hypothetical protein